MFVSPEFEAESHHPLTGEVLKIMLKILKKYYRVFQVTCASAHNYSPPLRCFSPAVEWCICFIMIFLFFHMIFNTSNITVKLNPAWDVLKIMWKNWNIIVIQTQHLTAVVLTCITWRRNASLSHRHTHTRTHTDIHLSLSKWSKTTWDVSYLISNINM